MPTSDIQCQVCGAPRTIVHRIRLKDSRDVMEVEYQCGAKVKKYPPEEKVTWIRDCHFKIRNDIY